MLSGPYQIRFTLTPTVTQFARISNHTGSESVVRDIIPVIKELRYFTGLGLKPAKDIIEAMLNPTTLCAKDIKVKVIDPEQVAQVMATRLEDILSERHGTNHNVVKGDFLIMDGFVVERLTEDTTVVI